MLSVANAQLFFEREVLKVANHPRKTTSICEFISSHLAVCKRIRERLGFGLLWDGCDRLLAWLGVTFSCLDRRATQRPLILQFDRGFYNIFTSLPHLRTYHYYNMYISIRFINPIIPFTAHWTDLHRSICYILWEIDKQLIMVQFVMYISNIFSILGKDVLKES